MTESERARLEAVAAVQRQLAQWEASQVADQLEQAVQELRSLVP